MIEEKELNTVVPAKETEGLNLKRILYTAIFDKWIPILLSGVLLTGLNYLYWEQKRVVQLEQKIFNKKIDNLSELNAANSLLFNKLYELIEYRDDSNDETDYKKSEKDIDNILSNISNVISNLKALSKDDHIFEELSSYVSVINSKNNTQTITEKDIDEVIISKWNEVKGLLYNDVRKQQK